MLESLDACLSGLDLFGQRHKSGNARLAPLLYHIARAVYGLYAILQLLFCCLLWLTSHLKSSPSPSLKEGTLLLLLFRFVCTAAREDVFDNDPIRKPYNVLRATWRRTMVYRTSSSLLQASLRN